MQQNQPRTIARLIGPTLLLLGLMLAACGRTPAPPMQVDFARLTADEPLTLRVGEAFTLVGYAPELVTVAADGIVHAAEATPPTTSTNRAPSTTLVAATKGQTAITVTQNMCEGVLACNGPALYLHLEVHVR